MKQLASQKKFMQKNSAFDWYYNQLTLSESTKQILLGGLLGDGSLKIAKNYRNARYSERHSVVQHDYLHWKFQRLNPELGGTMSVSPPDSTSFSDQAKVIYQSHVHPCLTQLHHLTHRDNEKHVQRVWLSPIDALALTVWWCDDGSLNARTRQGVWCTDGFTYDEVIILSDYLKSSWGIATQVKPVRPGQTRLHLDRQNLTALLNVVMPYIPVASMVYKVMPCMGNFEDQQRWISSAITACSSSSLQAYLTTCYDEPLRRYTTDQDFDGFYLRLRDVAHAEANGDPIRE